MSTKLDRSSVDARHWAEQFVKHAKENAWAIEDIDEGLMIGWFSNYRCAIEDNRDATIKALTDKNEILKAWLDEADASEEVYRDRIAELEAEYKALREAAKHCMKGCMRCKGKVRYQGKDFEELECGYCKPLAALQEKANGEV